MGVVQQPQNLWSDLYKSIVPISQVFVLYFNAYLWLIKHQLWLKFCKVASYSPMGWACGSDEVPYAS